MKVTFTETDYGTKCDSCGSLIMDKKLHEQYHKENHEKMMKIKDFMDQHRSKM